MNVLNENNNLLIDCILQARMGSTRLPGKVLLNIDETNTIIEFLIKQINQSKISRLIVAIPSSSENDVLEEYLKKMNITYFRGNEYDVLDRYYQCAKKFSLKHIMRLTGDNPLIDPEIVNLAIDSYNEAKCDCLTNSVNRTFPYGTEVEIFSFDSLEKAWENAEGNSEREHVTPYFYNNPNKFNIRHLTQSVNNSRFRYTVDQEEDFLLVKEIVKKIRIRPIITKNIIEILNENPDIQKINSKVKPKSLEQDSV